jgi:hypothetical protein
LGISTPHVKKSECAILNPRKALTFPLTSNTAVALYYGFQSLPMALSLATSAKSLGNVPRQQLTNMWIVVDPPISKASITQPLKASPTAQQPS